MAIARGTKSYQDTARQAQLVARLLLSVALSTLPMSLVAAAQRRADVPMCRCSGCSGSPFGQLGAVGTIGLLGTISAVSSAMLQPNLPHSSTRATLNFLAVSQRLDARGGTASSTRGGSVENIHPTL